MGSLFLAPGRGTDPEESVDVTQLHNLRILEVA